MPSLELCGYNKKKKIVNERAVSGFPFFIVTPESQSHPQLLILFALPGLVLSLTCLCVEGNQARCLSPGVLLIYPKGVFVYRRH